jgi:transcriptional regulator with XRE-family HTH domain
MSARGLAKKAGLSHTYIGLLQKGERGDQSGLTEASARKIATAAEVDLHWLMTGEGNPEPGAVGGSVPPALTQALTLLGDRLAAPVKAALRAERPPSTWTVEQWIERGLHLQAVYDKLP